MTCQQGASPSVVVPLMAEIDLTNSEQVYDRLDAAFAAGAAVVIADFTTTWFCDCASLRRLLTVQRRAAARGGQLRLVIPPGSPVERLAALIGVNGHLRIYPSLEEASGPAGSRPGSRGE